MWGRRPTAEETVTFRLLTNSDVPPIPDGSDERFVYLSWQRINGAGYVNRVKVRLIDIDWPLVRAAQEPGKLLEMDASGRNARGGRVPVSWTLADA